MRSHRYVMPFVLVCTVAQAALADNRPADPTLYVTDSVTVVSTVVSTVKNSITLSVADLRAKPTHALCEVSDCSASTNKRGSKNYRGVLLRDVIDRANIDSIGKNDLEKTLILAIASDQYKTLFTWSELFNTSIGDAVLVIYEKDGQPLAADEGHITLISGKDLRTGPRHVKWLKTIEIRLLSE